MNDLDNLMPKENDDAEQEMTDDELALYLEVLSSAYPEPKTDLKEAVTARIRDEQDQSSQAKKKSYTDRKKIAAKIVKWGSLAACTAIICLAGIKVIPSLGAKSENLAVSYDAANAEAYSDCGTGKAMTSSGSSAAPKAAETSDEPESQYEAEIQQYDAESYNSLLISGSVSDTEEGEAAAETEANTNGTVPYIAMYSVMSSSASAYDSPAENAAEDLAAEEEAVEEEPEKEYTEAAVTEAAHNIRESELSGQFEADLKRELIDAVRSAVSEETLPSSDASIEEITTALGISSELFAEILSDLTDAYQSQYPDTQIPVYDYENITKDTVK